MEALTAIGWAIWLIVAITALYETLGLQGICNMFPEGKRWWHFPAQCVAIGHFAAVAILNPWR
jgi:hypothetical protein